MTRHLSALIALGLVLVFGTTLAQDSAAGNDPIVAAAAVIGALQQIVARRLSPGEPGVVTVGCYFRPIRRSLSSSRWTSVSTSNSTRST